MKWAPGIILLAFISTWLCSCDKFTVGDITVETLTVDSAFQVIEFRDDVNVTLLHSDAAHPAGTIQIKAGANLINGIHTEISELTDINDDNNDTLVFNKLVIRNDNALNYLHTYNYDIDATIYYDTLFQLIFHSNARRIKTDTLRGYNYLTKFSQDTLSWDSLAPRLLLLVEGGSGCFNVLTNCYRITTKYIFGTADINVQGISVIASTFADFDCHGIIDCKDLYSHIHYITSNSTNRIIAKAFHMISAINDNIGQIEYVRFRAVRPHLCPPNDTDPTWHEEDTVYSCPQYIMYGGSNWDHIVPYVDQ